MANISLEIEAFIAAGGTQTILNEMTATLVRRKAIAEKFPVRWIIEIGTHATVEALVADTKASGVRFDDWTQRLLLQATVSPVRRTLRLVAPSVAELGFTRAAMLHEIHARAIEIYGLEFFPIEAVLWLSRQYTDQPKDEWLLMAMEAIRDTTRTLDAFRIGRYGDDRWVYLYYGSPGGGYCDLDCRLVFVLP